MSKRSNIHINFQIGFYCLSETATKLLEFAHTLSSPLPVETGPLSQILAPHHSILAHPMRVCLLDLADCSIL